ncbi:DUF2591 domain-containing protein [Enterobacteriaceae bacterium H11S18]|uniref:phage protein NinX family protein n=1 Tax=Dryocola clanedunensis TaxID=2925396 RepID=UPI0022F0BA2F|nr:phage protein NinX family protein [Dryocola clanedunensis]MCT4708791.1 DUF2591 domain-containing protein [Dryocola clanedunensis]
MTDYSQMSDADINLRIAKIMHPGKEFTLAYSFGQPQGPMVQWIQGYGEFLKLDYCNNPADAWPVITENKISIMFDSTDPKYEGEYHQWCDAISPCQNFGIQHQSNPLRAAMIVFLMMKDAENADS